MQVKFKSLVKDGIDTFQADSIADVPEYKAEFYKSMGWIYDDIESNISEEIKRPETYLISPDNVVTTSKAV